MSHVPDRTWPHPVAGATTEPPPDEVDADLARAVRSTSALRTGFYVVVLLIALGGQVSGAMEALHMTWYVALPAVGALELGGMVVLANADVRRRLGEHATLSRLLSAAIAGGAVAFNWLAHDNHLEGGFYGGMSLLGYLVWLMNTENKRRDRLRAKRRLPPTPPAYELGGHWLRHPWLTRRARSLAKAAPRLGLYDSLDAARAQIRAERRQAALSKVLHRKIRQALDGNTADIAVAVYDLDEIARRLADRADYDGLTALIAADLAPARVLAGNLPTRERGWRRGRRRPDPTALASAEQLLALSRPAPEQQREEILPGPVPSTNDDPEPQEATEVAAPQAAPDRPAAAVAEESAAPEAAPTDGPRQDAEPDAQQVPDGGAGGVAPDSPEHPRRPRWAAVTAELDALLQPSGQRQGPAQRRAGRPAVPERTAPARPTSQDSPGPAGPASQGRGVAASGAAQPPAEQSPARGTIPQPRRAAETAAVPARQAGPEQRRPSRSSVSAPVYPAVPATRRRSAPESGTAVLDPTSPVPPPPAGEIPLRDRPLPDLVRAAATRTIASAPVPVPGLSMSPTLATQAVPTAVDDRAVVDPAVATVGGGSGQGTSLRSRVHDALDRSLPVDDGRDTNALLDLVVRQLGLGSADHASARKYVRTWRKDRAPGQP